jgi:hypothetical protein
VKIRLTLAAIALMALSPAAEPPTLDSLRGSWWDEDGSAMFLFDNGDAGSVLDCPSQKTQPGRFQISDIGKLVFTPKEGPASAWGASRDGEFLVLAASDGTTHRCRHETRSDRELRCMAAHRDYSEAKRATEVPNAPEGEADRLWKRCDEAKVAYWTLLGSLAGDNSAAREKLLEELLERSSPEAAKAAREATQQQECSNALRQIGMYCSLYENKFKAWPKNLAALERPDMATDKKAFRCPVTGNDNAYAYVFPSKDFETPLDAVMLYDRDPHPNAKRGVVCFSGEVIFLGKEDFELALKEGVDKARPQVQVVSARIVDEGGKRQLVVEGKLSRLKASGKDPNPGVRGTVTLEVAGRRKVPLESLPVRLEGAAGSQMPFTVRVGLGSEVAKDLMIWAVVHDDVREDDFRTRIELTK